MSNAIDLKQGGDIVEKVNKEYLEKLLLSKDIENEIKENIENLLLIIPELKDMIGFEHKHPHHHLDVWDHTLCALSFSNEDLDVRLALLLHDVGKPKSYQEDGEFRHFHGHAEVSAKMAKNILNRLGYDKEYIDYICKLILMHDTPLSENDIKNDYKFSNKLFDVQICDISAHNPKYNEKRLAYINRTWLKFMQ